MKHKRLKKSLLLLITIILFLFLFCLNLKIDSLKSEKNRELIFENKKINNIDEDRVDKSKITLKSFNGFYQSNYPIKNIESITFTNTKPEIYDEYWFANIANTSDIMGYRLGNSVYIVGNEINFNLNSQYMFSGVFWENLKEINGLDFISTKNVRYFTNMFYGLNSVKYLDVGTWDMSKAEDISFMFAFCTALEYIDVSNWNVSNIRNFSGLFEGHSNTGDMSLKEIDVSKWNTSSAVYMNHVFYGCSQLEYIDISNWDVKNVVTFSHMFADCYNLKELNFSKWETLSVKTFDAFLNDCHSLKRIDVSGLDTATCEQFSQMFESCINLEEIIGLENFDTSNANNFAFCEMFHCCKKIKKINVSSFNTHNADNMVRMFAKCYELEELDISHFDFSNIVYKDEMFLDTKKIF